MREIAFLNSSVISPGKILICTYTNTIHAPATVYTRLSKIAGSSDATPPLPSVCERRDCGGRCRRAVSRLPSRATRSRPLPSVSSGEATTGEAAESAAAERSASAASELSVAAERPPSVACGEAAASEVFRGRARRFAQRRLRAPPSRRAPASSETPQPPPSKAGGAASVASAAEPPSAVASSKAARAAGGRGGAG